VEAAAAKREAKWAALEAEGLLPEEIAEILDDEDADMDAEEDNMNVDG
jgi:hypothetical protein